MLCLILNFVAFPACRDGPKVVVDLGSLSLSSKLQAASVGNDELSVCVCIFTHSFGPDAIIDSIFSPRVP